jgi:hypothetical protein
MLAVLDFAMLSAPVRPDIPSWEESEWNRLLLLIESGTVVPIIGSELSLNSASSEGRLRLKTLATELAKRLNVSADALPAELPLNEIACRLADKGGLAQDLSLELYQLLQASPLPPSAALRQLAAVTDLQLFVTTAFDTALETALGETRLAEVVSLSYAPNDIQDLPGPHKTLTQPVVYHLLGKLAVNPSYAVTEEDKLEFFHSLLSPQRRPERLFTTLAASHLLIIGGGYTDWLARFFLRASKGERRLSDPRTVWEFMADRTAAADPALVLFLKHFSKATRLFPDAEPAEFVTELHRRWGERNPSKLWKAESAAAQEPMVVRPPEQMPDRAIFISYAREDVAAVSKLFTGLSERGFNVWFDFERLEAGDEFAQKIQRSIQRCSMFMPVISRHTEGRRPRFFRREWRIALDREQDYLPDAPFIIPVAIDDIPEATAQVPDRFLNKHWTRLAGGEVTDEFANQLRRKLGELGE